MSDATRIRYLVCYDVSSPKRWRKIYQFLLGFRAGGQKSFFECWLTASELNTLRQGLSVLLDTRHDRAHIFQLDERQKPFYFGRATASEENAVLIV
jgi:CRISPR-associated protein Cas2